MIEGAVAKRNAPRQAMNAPTVRSFLGPHESARIPVGICMAT